MAPKLSEPEIAPWLVERNSPVTGYIGGSEVAAVLGVSPYDSLHDVWLTKVKGQSKAETLAMRRGTFIEPFIASEFSRETGIECKPARLVRHPKWPFIAANLDREFDFNGYRCILECKDLGFFAGLQFGDDGADCVAEHYLVQCSYALIPDNHDFICLCVLMDGRELRKFWYTYKPELHDVDLPGSTEKKAVRAHVLDKDMARNMVKRVCEVWEKNIVGGKEPPLSHTDSDTAFCKKERATYENGQKTNTDEKIDKECKLLASTLKTLSKYEKVASRRKNQIRQFMAERGASELESTVGVFTWRTNVRGVATFNTPFKSGNY